MENTEEIIEEPGIKYVKDRPFRALFKQMSIITISAVIILAVVGFIMGWVGARVPYIDSGAIGNQWNSMFGGDEPNSGWNELEKNP